MGAIRVTVRVSELGGGGKPFEADFLVDTGAHDCMAPGDHLAEAGVRPEGKATFELASGDPVDYEYGFARLAFMGDETVARILFGPNRTEPILGVVALESVGIVVDPVAGTLKRLLILPLK